MAICNEITELAGKVKGAAEAIGETLTCAKDSLEAANAALSPFVEDSENPDEQDEETAKQSTPETEGGGGGI